MGILTSGPKATVLGSYRDAEIGKAAMEAARRAGFHRSVGFTRLTGGSVGIAVDQVLAWLGAFLGLVLGMALVAAYFTLGFAPPPASPNQFVLCLAPISIAALVGFVSGRFLSFALNRHIISDYRRWVLPGEMLVVVQAPVRSAQEVLELLRRVERGQPATFVIRSLRAVPSQPGEALSRERLTSDRLRAHAARVASAHRIAPHPEQTISLRARARDSKATVEAVNADLTEGTVLGQSISTAAEWLLDNGYIVQRHIGDVLDNLSGAFYEVLPVLAGDQREGCPRVYDLAVEFVGHVDSEIFEQDIIEFLTAYQEVTPLTMAELWAMPLMIRLALVENLSYVAVDIDRRQLQHEMADFWANRLLNATRRAPDHFLSVMAEFAREQREVSPYFAERLVSQLQGEPATLEPVLAWLERKWGVPVAEVIQEEQRRHAAAQVTIASTIGSLRRLSHLDWRETFEQVSLVDRILRTDPSGVYPRMDFDTRNRYRRTIEQIARRSRAGEAELARAAVEAAQSAEAGSRRHHVGFFLEDSGLQELEVAAQYRVPAVAAAAQDRHASTPPSSTLAASAC